MKPFLLTLLTACALFAQAKPATPAPAITAASITEKQRGDFWRAQYNVSQDELRIARARIDALEKMVLDPALKSREQAGQAIARSCPDAKLDAAGELECPVPKTPAKP